MNSDISSLTFEEALRDMEKVVEKLEEENVTLEDSIDLYQKGMELFKVCNQKLKEAEKKISQLVEENGEIKKVSVGN
ncbi:exodeoxyribonuclease VII small subunit [Bacillus sp. OK048]|uniref:exodeoxyribonuclease VII small subunit n=1 Tax=Bacillus sp. OK048 TaxID=1882761 RepID=UPI00089109E3|nr:exodeoxyribonuclease VII small subunit [Bacillus sp. OK048]SDN62932.1 Exodeoxyribonuclease VII small subunit [Bacillus sp. OK048]